MKITIEHEGLIATVEDEGVVTIEEAVVLVRYALLGAGLPKVDEYIPDGDWLPMSEHFEILEGKTDDE